MIPGTTEGVCYICGRIGDTDCHHIFGGSTRKQCDRDGLMVYLCKLHHTGRDGVHSSKGKDINQYLHEVGQREFEKTHSRDEFIKRYIKSYL